MSTSIPPWESLSDPVLQDQLGTYDRMRAQCPIAQSPRGVTLFRHADVVAAAHDPATFSSSASGYRAVPNSLDPPEHSMFRAIIDPFFAPERMRALRPRIDRIADALVHSLPRGVTVDAVKEIGYPFAVRAQAEWLGWSGIEEELLAWMGANHEATRSGDRTRTAAVAAAFDELILAQLRHRRETADQEGAAGTGVGTPEDPTTELMRLTVEGRPLTDAEIVSILRNWTAGDLGSIAASVGVVVHFVATYPEVQTSLRDGDTDPRSRSAESTDPAAAVDEMLRIDDPFLVNRRVTTKPTRVAGFDLEPGTRVYLNWASANRDESVFGDPNAYRPEEHSAHNLVYGTGIHACPGRPLATLELVTILQALLRQTSRIELAKESAPVRETYPLGGWRSVPVRLG